MLYDSATPNYFILTPFFLDQPRDALKEVAQPHWTSSLATLLDSETHARILSAAAQLKPRRPVGTLNPNVVEYANLQYLSALWRIHGSN